MLMTVPKVSTNLLVVLDRLHSEELAELEEQFQRWHQYREITQVGVNTDVYRLHGVIKVELERLLVLNQRPVYYWLLGFDPRDGKVPLRQLHGRLVAVDMAYPIVEIPRLKTANAPYSTLRRELGTTITGMLCRLGSQMEQSDARHTLIREELGIN